MESKKLEILYSSKCKNGDLAGLAGKGDCAKLDNPHNKRREPIAAPCPLTSVCLLLHAHGLICTHACTHQILLFIFLKFADKINPHMELVLL